jgi:two-component system NtrC family sensor kinase
VNPWVLGILTAAGGFVVGALVARRKRAPDPAAELTQARAEVSRRLADVFALQELSFVLSESLQPKRIAEQIIGYLKRFTDVGGALVALAAETGGTARVAASHGSLLSLQGREIPDDDPGLLVAALGQERMLQGDAASGTAPVVAAGVTASRAIVFPLRAHGVTVGALAVADPRGGIFDTDTLRLLTTVATHAAIVLSNARFFDLVRSGRDEWETTFNALTEGLAVVDGSDAIRRANRALASLVNRSVSALSSRPLFDILPYEPAKLRRLVAAARAGGPVQPIAVRTDQGRTLRIAAAPIGGNSGAGLVIVLVEDVTDQEALESQLIQSEKMAAVGQLVSGVAHELNNPLTSIAGLAEFLLERSPPDDRDREHVRVIREQADRAARIVRNLLTFARKEPAENAAFDLNDIVQRTVALVAYEVGLREIKLDLALDGTLPPLAGDRYQIQQVVLNLVANAVHAVSGNPAGRPRRIAITLSRAGDDAVLTVRDTGPGIPDEQLPHIFTPFFTTKEPGQGTGLGLSVSYRIVEGHGGALTVKPAAGAGAEFTMRLPIGRRAAELSRVSLTSEQLPQPEGETATAVLVVDEDPGVRRMLTVLLAGSNHAVDAAADTSQATGFLEERQYDLVIADARVAVSAGERFADYLLRRWPELRMRTVFLTADVRPDTETWLRALGCPFFFKPFRMGELKAAIGKVLRERAAPSGSAPRPPEHGLEPG